MIEKSFDKIADGLSDVYRRKILKELFYSSSGEIKMENLKNSPVIQNDLELIHSHIPKLENYGYICFHSSENKISVGPKFDNISPILELLLENESKLEINFV